MKYFSFYSYLYGRNIFFSKRDFLSVRLNEPFLRLHDFALLVCDYCCRETRIKFVGFFYSLLDMNRVNRGLHYASHSLLQTGNSYKSPEESPHTEHSRLR